MSNGKVVFMLQASKPPAAWREHFKKNGPWLTDTSQVPARHAVPAEKDRLVVMPASIPPLVHKFPFLKDVLRVEVTSDRQELTVKIISRSVPSPALRRGVAYWYQLLLTERDKLRRISRHGAIMADALARAQYNEDAKGITIHIPVPPETAGWAAAQIVRLLKGKVL